MTPQASFKVTTNTPATIVPQEEDYSVEWKDLGSVEAEILILSICPVNEYQDILSAFEDKEISFSSHPQVRGKKARFVSLSSSAQKNHAISFDEIEHFVNNLRSVLQSMKNLHLVLPLGVSAHIAVLEACGIPMTHLDFRSNFITFLPDGLLIGDLLHPATEEHFFSKLDDFLPHIIDSLNTKSSASLGTQ
ncbi:uracil-DNA glycosylase family protein [Swingsia samuiensis]|uniref:Uracil-DNA glycosylase-like domain-containing protein n=1 Tax=Swingsia samuiensis TaxID=1293412 RepID=A0A4Y6UKB7_9PROT|nr:hypothetical protein [Swingsia samuiensis]QDH17514.1 hypothetical protein E3D00_08020 [Swingsia samuiensis]